MAWPLPSLNCMGPLLEPVQQEYLPICCINPGPCMVSATVGLPAVEVPGSSNFNPPEPNGAHGLYPFPPLQQPDMHATSSPYLREKQSAFAPGYGGKAGTDVTPGSLEKKFLIFDQSGNQTKMIYGSLYSPVQNTAAAVPKHLYGSNLKRAKVDQFNIVKHVLQEETDENNLSEKGSEMHEDTEEINALLYSDEDDEDGSSDEDDETMSTGHSPVLINGIDEKREQFEEITEAVGSCGRSNKRQKLLGGYSKKLEPVESDGAVKMRGFQEFAGDAESSYAVAITHGASTESDYGDRKPGKGEIPKKLTRVHYKKLEAVECDGAGKLDGVDEYGSDGESSHGQAATPEEETESVLGDQIPKKFKIRETLKILESIIPGAKGKDPLLVIDGAIDYLKSLKLKAKILGVN